MNRNEFKEKIINRIVFRSKISNQEAVDLLKRRTMDELMIYYVIIRKEPETLQEYHNSFAWLRKYCKPLLKMKSDASKDLREIQEDYNKFVKYTGAKNISDLTLEQSKRYELCLEAINKQEAQVKTLESLIMLYNTKLETICDFYDKHNLPFHDFCQLINMRESVARLNIREEEDDDDSTEKQRYYRYLFQGVESDRSEPEWKENKSNGMPCFELISKSIRMLIFNNKEAKEKVHNYLMDNMGLASAAMTLTTDENGNQVLSKYYPKLRVVSTK